MYHARGLRYEGLYTVEGALLCIRHHARTSWVAAGRGPGAILRSCNAFLAAFRDFRVVLIRPTASGSMLGTPLLVLFFLRRGGAKLYTHQYLCSTFLQDILIRMRCTPNISSHDVRVDRETCVHGSVPKASFDGTCSATYRAAVFQVHPCDMSWDVSFASAPVGGQQRRLRSGCHRSLALLPQRHRGLWTRGRPGAESLCHSVSAAPGSLSAQ